MEANTETKYDPYDIQDNFPEQKKKEYDYAVIPKGVRLVGLVAIKPIVKTVMYEGVKQQKNAYRFVFRDKQITNAFLNKEVNSANKNNSDLYKFLEELTGKRFGTEFADKKIMMTWMKECIGCWFDAFVKHEPWKKDASKFTPKGMSFEPQGRGQMDAIEFFKDIKIPLKKNVEEEDDGDFPY